MGAPSLARSSNIKCRFALSIGTSRHRDLQTRAKKSLPGPSVHEYGLAFGPDNRLAVIGTDHVVHIHDPATGADAGVIGEIVSSGPVAVVSTSSTPP